MKTVDVNISFVNPPKPGKKMGSIKTKDNVLYWVYADKLAQFSPGMHTIEYTDDPGRDGKPFLKALSVLVPCDQLPNGGTKQIPIPDMSPSRVIKPFPADPQEHSGEYLKNRHIFVCGAINNAIASKQIDVTNKDELKAIVQMLGDVYDDSLGRPL